MKVKMLLVGLALALLVSTCRTAEICCDHICFDDNPPYDHLPVPDCAQNMGIEFHLYTKANREVPQIMTHEIIPEAFLERQRIHFLVHGYQEDINTEWLHDMKNGIVDFRSVDYNVVIMGWGKGAADLYYPQAAANIRAAGVELARVLDNILDVFPFQNELDVYYMGFGLGAHLIAHASRASINRFGKISGINPAGPMFDSYPLSLSLNGDSAVRVNVYHTDTEYGSLRPLGGTDYYPNGGRVMPGCESKTVACSHRRAIDYYMITITGTCYVYFMCTDPYDIPASCDRCVNGNICGSMGYGDSQPGIYYGEITEEAPYTCIRPDSIN